jgi:ubiquinone/menaquinone biosynthesis C-methylase UbiE
MFKKALDSMYVNAMGLNDRNIYEALKEHGPFDHILDVGCWDGEKSLRYAKAAGASRISGIEIVEEKAQAARRNGVSAYAVVADRELWPFEDGSVACVVSNQVIEHLSNVDHFIAEASRVLVPGGGL